jgi:crossover junction endodeoxyribonuclease RusA
MPSKATLSEALRQATIKKHEFFVAGTPACQGSKTAFGRAVKDKNTGKLKVVVNMVEQDKNLSSWRASVGNVARLMLPSDWEMEGLFVLRVLFYLPRPKLHYTSLGRVKPSSPVFHSQKKDYDKLLRAIGDSLTGVCYQDDAMIVSGSAMKVFTPEGRQAGAWISVARLDEEHASQLAIELLP